MREMYYPFLNTRKFFSLLFRYVNINKFCYTCMMVFLISYQTILRLCQIFKKTQRSFILPLFDILPNSFSVYNGEILVVPLPESTYILRLFPPVIHEISTWFLPAADDSWKTSGKSLKAHLDSTWIFCSLGGKRSWLHGSWLKVFRLIILSIKIFFYKNLWPRFFLLHFEFFAPK